MFGDMVRAHRGRLGITQEELADRSGVSVRGLGKIEAGRIGRPRPSTVRLLADAFGLSGAERDRFCAAAGPKPAPETVGEPTRRPAPAQLPPDVAGSPAVPSSCASWTCCWTRVTSSRPRW
jgi:transcriptional regulator with XRE-family HTH domain